MFHLSNCLPPIHWAHTRLKKDLWKAETWSHHSGDCVPHYPWMKMNFCLPALPDLSPATCPDLSVHHPSGHFLGSLNLTRLFHLLKCLLLSLTQMLPQILTPRVLVPSHSITIADTPPKPRLHAHIFNCYHSLVISISRTVSMETVIMLIESLVTKPFLGSIDSQ